MVFCFYIWSIATKSYNNSSFINLNLYKMKKDIIEAVLFMFGGCALFKILLTLIYVIQ